MPILEPVISLQKLYEQSPVLFWALALTASRHHPHHSQLYEQMREPYHNLFSGMISRPIHALKDLHALLTLCHWPFEVEAQVDDPSWSYTGMAVNAALNMGLDKFEDEILFGHR
jgi:hypothetical protein